MTQTCISVRVVLHIIILTTLLSAVAISQASSSIGEYHRIALVEYYN